MQDIFILWIILIYHINDKTIPRFDLVEYLNLILLISSFNSEVAGFDTTIQTIIARLLPSTALADSVVLFVARLGLESLRTLICS